jgi:glycerophosphoryl diester phosphodiesterase
MVSGLILLATVFSFNAHSVVDWQGHRGARGLYPENTIGAMEEALKYPVTTLEMDVVVSKDLQVVVSHEPWMNEEICLDPQGKKVKNKEHNLYKMTYEEIQKFDCGSLPHSRFPQQKKINVGKPTIDKLIEVTEVTLKNLNRESVQYNIEIKSAPEHEEHGFQPDVAKFSDIVLKAITAKIPVSKFTIQSFDWRVLQYINKIYPDVRLVALKEDDINPEKDLKLLGFKPYVYSPYFKKLEQKDVDGFHNEGIKVIPWTVNDVKSMEGMLGMKVDGIITDYPNLITEVNAKKCKEGTNLFEGKCVILPEHSLPSDQNPGWKCRPGHAQKRSSCVKIKVPKNGFLLPDGKGWECLEGFVRYRSTCKKV